MSVIRNIWRFSEKFKEITELSSSHKNKIKYDTVHSIHTIGPPVSARANWLKPAQLKIAEQEFECQKGEFVDQLKVLFNIHGWQVVTAKILFFDRDCTQMTFIQKIFSQTLEPSFSLDCQTLDPAEAKTATTAPDPAEAKTATTAPDFA
ncbi:hypothetical protein AVEN_109890-1 [Araneus ventricosus]|uniref:Uncharacterized protein n=1 Tax=Araneus ventricosus TaxID=182803 RepID=A0A4Y2N2Q4_ARAVE|nr:hypothetical protein AVEN_109890-1 [Araneus ventricosus]